VPTIDGIQLDNPAFGWSHRATSEPIPSYESDLSTLKRAGRDGVVSYPGDTAAVLLRIVVQTPFANLESLKALFKQGKVWGNRGRESAYEFKSDGAVGYGPADGLVDATFVIRLPGAFMRPSASETTPLALTSATHTLSCFGARPVGLVSQWQNLSISSGFEAPGSSVEVRRNFWQDPNFTTTSAALYGQTGGTGTAAVSGGRMVCTSTGASAVRLGVVHTLANVKPAGTYYFGVDVKSSSGNLQGARIYLYDSATATIRATVNFAAPTTETRIEVTATATGVFDRIYLEFYGTAIASGDSGTFYRPYLSNMPGAFIGGTTQAVPDADLTAAFSGTVNASETVLSGTGVVGIASSMGVAMIRSSFSWPGRQGAYSLRQIPTSTTNNVSYASLTIPAAAIGGTLIVTGHQEAALTGSLWVLRGRVYTNPAGSGNASPQMPNAAGTQEHRVAISAAQAGFILPHGGLAGSGDVWWDLVMVTATPNYTGPAFTGSTTPPDRLSTIVWDGLPDQSSSTWTTYASWDGGLSAPVQDAVLRMKGPATGIQITDSSGAWVVLPDTPAGTWTRFEADTGRCFQTTTDTWSGGTEVSGSCDFGGPRGVFEITPVMAPGDPGSRSGQLTVATVTRTGAVFEVRGKAAYLL